MRRRLIKIVSGVLLALALLAFPVISMMILFGLAGADAENFILIAVGYGIAAGSSLGALFREKIFPLIFVGIALMVVGFVGDSNFWAKQNRQLCADLRRDPTCVEDRYGFHCSDFQGQGGFNVGSGVCDN